MRARSFAAAAALAGSVVGLSASIAGAEAPTPVVINAHPCTFGPPAEVGIWEASGAINDSGTFVRTDVAVSPPDRPMFSPGPFREEFAFTGLLGTFTVNAEELARDSGGKGVWQIKSGTGAYEATSGHGDTAFTFVPTLCGFTFALTGIASKVG